MTQGPLSQGFLSQPGLSQADFSQDSCYLEHFQSQADGLLSQDSTYQADPSYFAHSQSGGMSGPGMYNNSQNMNRNLSNNNNPGRGSGGQLSQF